MPVSESSASTRSAGTMSCKDLKSMSSSVYHALHNHKYTVRTCVKQLSIIDEADVAAWVSFCTEAV